MWLLGSKTTSHNFQLMTARRIYHRFSFLKIIIFNIDTRAISWWVFHPCAFPHNKASTGKHVIKLFYYFYLLSMYKNYIKKSRNLIKTWITYVHSDHVGTWWMGLVAIHILKEQLWEWMSGTFFVGRCPVRNSPSIHISCLFWVCKVF